MRATLKARVVPNARRSEVAGFMQEEVRVKIQAPAHEGKANAELIRFLSELIGCAKSSIIIKRGEKSRNKVIEIEGVSPQEVWRKLGIRFVSGD
jgi:uncharacterized protein (TIGR00251 family)